MRYQLRLKAVGHPVIDIWVEGELPRIGEDLQVFVADDEFGEWPEDFRIEAIVRSILQRPTNESVIEKVDGPIMVVAKSWG